MFFQKYVLWLHKIETLKKQGNEEEIKERFRNL